MKKIILYSMCAFISVGTFGQRTAALKQAVDRVPEKSAGDVNLQANTFYKVAPHSKKNETAAAKLGSRATITYIELGDASNVFGISSTGPNQVSYNSDLNSITFTHRMNAPVPGGGGSVGMDYSTNGGATWTKNILATPDFGAGDYAGTIIGSRYPNGAIYNPSGNTNPANAYNIFTAVSHDDAAASNAWGYIYRGSSKFDGSAVDEGYYQNDGTSDEYIPNGLDVASTGLIYAINPTFNNTGVTSKDTLNFRSFRLLGAAWNALTESAVWGYTEYVPGWHRYVGATGILSNYGAYDYSVSFSPDGTTGYAVMMGGRQGDPIYYVHPAVLKSTDGGLSWNWLPDFDFSSLTEVQNWILPTSAGDYLPEGFNIDITVDANNRLNIFSETASKYTSSNADDSLLSTTGFDDGTGTVRGYIAMMHFTTSNGSDWTAALVDTFIQDYGLIPSSDGLADVNPDFRPQIGRTEDGTKIFFTWSLSDPTVQVENVLPDLWGMGYDVASGLYTPKTNFTEGTEYSGSIYFPALSPIVIDGGDDYDYELPIVFAIPESYSDLTTNFYYIKGVGFNDEQFGAGPNAIANFTFTPGAAGVVSFNNTSAFADSYLWDFGDLATSPLTSPPHTYATNGTYTVCLTATNATSSDTECKPVGVTSANAVIDVALDNALKVYPTLTAGNITISAANSTNLTVEVYNMLGAKVLSTSMNSTTTIDLSNVAVGNYLVKVASEKGIATRQITVAK